MSGSKAQPATKLRSSLISLKARSFKRDSDEYADRVMQQVEQSVIDVIIQLKRGERGKRFVSEIYFKEDKAA